MPARPAPQPVEEEKPDALTSNGPISFTQEPRAAAAMIEGAEIAVQARIIENEEVSRMARQLEDIYPCDGAQRNSAWWRPTTAVRPGKTFARLGEGPSYTKDHYGNVLGGNNVRPVSVQQIATRPRVYPYSGYGWGQPGYVRQPRAQYAPSCGYQQPSYGCGYQQPRA